MVGRDPLSISTYEDLGYKRTVAKDGGVRLGGGSVVDGSTIANKDTIMMEISKEEHDRLVAEGVGGAGGQRWAKHLEEQLESRPLPDGLQRRVGDRSRMHFRFDNLDG